MHTVPGAGGKVSCACALRFVGWASLCVLWGGPALSWNSSTSAISNPLCQAPGDWQCAQLSAPQQASSARVSELIVRVSAFQIRAARLEALGNAQAVGTLLAQRLSWSALEFDFGGVRRRLELVVQVGAASCDIILAPRAVVRLYVRGWVGVRCWCVCVWGGRCLDGPSVLHTVCCTPHVGAWPSARPAAS